MYSIFQYMWISCLFHFILFFIFGESWNALSLQCISISFWLCSFLTEYWKSVCVSLCVCAAIFTGSKYTCTSNCCNQLFRKFWKFSVLNSVLVTSHQSDRSSVIFIVTLLFSHFALFPVFNFLSKLMFGPCSIAPIPFLWLQTFSVDALIPCEYEIFEKSHNAHHYYIISFVPLLSFVVINVSLCLRSMNVFTKVQINGR